MNDCTLKPRYIICKQHAINANCLMNVTYNKISDWGQVNELGTLIFSMINGDKLEVNYEENLTKLTGHLQAIKSFLMNEEDILNLDESAVA